MSVLPDKPPLTATTHQLPFEKLSGAEFERLCYWLVLNKGFEQAEYLGEAGSDGGRDIQAFKGERRFVFQCKRVKDFEFADAKHEIAKLRSSPPDELVFVLPRAVSSRLRKRIKNEWGNPSTCTFWSGAELDYMAKAEPKLLKEFFNLESKRLIPEFIHNLPLASMNNFFKGRESELAALVDFSSKTPPGSTVAQVLCGPGGVGKTRLALEYAWRGTNRYHYAFFVRADNPTELRRGLIGLAAFVDLSLDPSMPEHQAQDLVLASLQKRRNWLLILDNVDDEETQIAVRKLLSLAGGEVLITTRFQAWPVHTCRVPVQVFSPASAAEFLLDVTDGKRLHVADDRASASELAQLLGYLPLALELTAAYISENGLGLFELIQNWPATQRSILTWRASAFTDYPDPLGTIWNSSFEKLSILAKLILQIVAHFAPSPIAISMLTQNRLLEQIVTDRGNLQGQEPSTFIRSGINELVRYSLVQRNLSQGQDISIHPLLQEVALSRILPKDKAIWVTVAAIVVSNSIPFPIDEPKNWGLMELIRPHAARLIDLAEAARVPHVTLPLMRELAIFLMSTTSYEQAEPLLRKVLAVSISSNFDSAKIIHAKRDLALVLTYTGNLLEAESLASQAVAYYEAEIKPDPAEFVMSQSIWIGVLVTMKRSVTHVEPFARRALAFAEEHLGPDSRLVATQLNNLAIVLGDREAYTEAEFLLRRSLDIYESKHGPDHPEVATSLNNLASLLAKVGRKPEAEELIRRAVSILDRILAPEHPSAALFRENLRNIVQSGRSF